MLRLDLLVFKSDSNVSANYLRDSPLARFVLDGWIDDRCGFKDQYPLWHTLLAAASRAHCLNYDGEIYGMLSHDAMKRAAAVHPALDVNASALRAACADFKFAPTKFDRPIHRSVYGDQVATFAYRGDDGADRVLNVSNLLQGTPRERALLAAIGLGALDPDAVQ